MPKKQSLDELIKGGDVSLPPRHKPPESKRTTFSWQPDTYEVLERISEEREHSYKDALKEIVNQMIPFVDPDGANAASGDANVLGQEILKLAAKPGPSKGRVRKSFVLDAETLKTLTDATKRFNLSRDRFCETLIKAFDMIVQNSRDRSSQKLPEALSKVEAIQETVATLRPVITEIDNAYGRFGVAEEYEGVVMYLEQLVNSLQEFLQHIREAEQTRDRKEGNSNNA